MTNDPNIAADLRAALAAFDATNRVAVRDVYDHLLEFLRENACYSNAHSGHVGMFESHGTVLDFKQVDTVFSGFSAPDIAAVRETLRQCHFTPVAGVLSAFLGYLSQRTKASDDPVVPGELSFKQLYALAESHGLDISPRLSPDDPALRSAKHVRLFFPAVNVDAWKALMSHRTPIPVLLGGTRQMTGSGATDGQLHPEYVQVLAEVNAARKALGLEPVQS